MAGSVESIFYVSVEPWTMTAALYPGARWTAVRDADAMVLTPVSQQQKLLTAGALAGLLVASLWPTTSGQGSS